MNRELFQFFHYKNEKYQFIYDNLIELKQKKGDYKKIQD